MEMQSNPMSPSASEKYDEKMAGEFGGPGAPASYYEYKLRERPFRIPFTSKTQVNLEEKIDAKTLYFHDPDTQSK